jgi:predicted CXXCH cytochrome family protein
MKISMTLVMILALALAACAGVLGLRPTSQSHPFEHRAHVDKGVSCVKCHAGISTSDDGNAVHLPTANECRKCHEKPHDQRDCTLCHGEASTRQSAEMAREHLRFDHRKHMPAVHGDCVQCHSGVAEAQPVALRPTMATCFGCHEHQDQWKTRDCDSCHVNLPGEHVLPSSHIVHDGDWIREHGVRAASSPDLCRTCHTERSCASCHGVGTTPALPARLAFDDTRLDGLHRAGFKSRHAEEARANPGLCSTCHSENSCIACHSAAGVAPSGITRSPHPLGWITTSPGGGDHGTQARIDPMSCAGCHGGAGEQLCVSCHKVGGPGGTPHGHGFTSTKNKTRDVPCRSCHAAGL